MKLYCYVGPEDIRRRATHAPPGARIQSVSDLTDWLSRTKQEPNPEHRFAVTFVVDDQGFLRVADRGSEHVACAGGGPIQSTGEIFFLLTDRRLEVEDVTNQSTGYCPEPESWPAVAYALDRIGIPHPGRFTHEVLFRRCPICGKRSIVKDGWFVCGLCGADLPPTWNF